MKRLLVLLLLGMASGVQAAPMRFENGALLQDSEISSIFESFFEPAMKAIGHQNDVTLYLVCGDQINAFATGDRSIYVTTGIIIDCRSVEELLAVLFHELGHIEGHHVINRIEAMKRSYYSSLIPLLLGALAAGLGGGDLALLGLGSTFGSLLSSAGFTGFTRQQESMADQFSLKMLEKLSLPATGFSAFMQRLSQKEGPYIKDYPLYMRTHPFSKERHDAAQHYVKSSAQKKITAPEKFKRLFETMKIKVLAFSSPLKQALNHVDKAPVNDDLKPYGRAIVYFRRGNAPQALKQLDIFEKENKSPFTQELRAQILFESHRFPEALAAINEATKKRPWDAGLGGLKAQILIENGQPDKTKEAIRTLERVLLTPTHDPSLWYWLGVAYGRSQNVGRMRVCFAEQALLSADSEKAAFHVKAARKALSPNDRYAHRLPEIESAVERLREELDKLRSQRH